MRAGSSLSLHDLDSPWPAFLDLLDTDPRATLEGLHSYAWKLFEVRPPSITFGLDRMDREDRISNLVLSCCVDDFRKLRKYQNVGRPFAAWLSTVLTRQVLDWRRSQRPTDEITETIGAVDDEPPTRLSPLVRECLDRCMNRMSGKCQKYLTLSSHGMKPREIVELLQLPEGQNKHVSDDLRQCLKRMREELLREGVIPDEVLG